MHCLPSAVEYLLQEPSWQRNNAWYVVQYNCRLSDGWVALDGGGADA